VVSKRPGQKPAEKSGQKLAEPEDNDLGSQWGTRPIDL
jgi:hypothetical protein